MKKLFLFLSILFGIFLSAKAQNIKSYNQENILKAGFLGPSILYEIKLDDALTVVTEAGVTFSFGYSGNAIGWIFDYGLSAGASPRYYYNFDDRLEDGKSIEHFSGNYISLFTRAYLYEVLSSMTQEPNQFLIGPTWGLQRNLGKAWYYNIQLGAGASFTKEETMFTPLLGFNIGFRF